MSAIPSNTTNAKSNSNSKITIVRSNKGVQLEHGPMLSQAGYCYFQQLLFQSSK